MKIFIKNALFFPLDRPSLFNKLSLTILRTFDEHSTTECNGEEGKGKIYVKPLGKALPKTMPNQEQDKEQEQDQERIAAYALNRKGVPSHLRSC